MTKSLYGLPTEDLKDVAPTEEPVLEWAEPAKDAEEERKREAIDNYMKWIMKQPEFKDKLNEEIRKAFDEGRI